MSDSELVTFNEPKSVISEAFITLRTNIQFMNVNKKLKTLLITSSLPGEGKSWVSSNLAISFAQLGKKVLLIDADLRKGRINEIFEIKREPGLSNYLSETTEEEVFWGDNLKNIIKQTSEPNLSVISAGTFPPNPSELLVSLQMKKLLDVLEQNFDIVIIDGTPCELIADSKILSRIVDSTIVVTEYNKTKKEILKRTIKEIKNVGGNIIGIVINKIPYKSKEYYYRTEYYYGENQQNVKNKNNVLKIKEKILKKNEKIKDEQKKTKANAEKIKKEKAEKEEQEKIAKQERTKQKEQEKQEKLKQREQEEQEKAKQREQEKQEKAKQREQEKQEKEKQREQEEQEKAKQREQEEQEKAKQREQAEQEKEKMIAHIKNIGNKIDLKEKFNEQINKVRNLRKQDTEVRETQDENSEDESKHEENLTEMQNKSSGKDSQYESYENEEQSEDNDDGNYNKYSHDDNEITLNGNEDTEESDENTDVAKKTEIISEINEYLKSKEKKEN